MNGNDLNGMVGKTHLGWARLWPRKVVVTMWMSAAPVMLAYGSWHSSSVGTSARESHDAVRVIGSVTYSGVAPAPEKIDLSADQYCSEARADEPVYQQPIKVGAGGALANVVVYVKEGLNGSDTPPPQQPVTLDQQDCIYRPRVLAMRAGQTLVIRNSDATLHNVHVYAQRNKGFNIGQPLKGIEAKRRFEYSEVPIDVRCDIHGWMHGVIAVFDHGHFAVTGDDGQFMLEGLPPGEYVIEAWHETLGGQTKRVSLGTGASQELTFSFK